ncbi:MAG: hypothetical protein KDD62_15730 [Bdellovibrionales bacterium]|nr:hypothetical protein [Bdellovibrionales bacterium]
MESDISIQREFRNQNGELKNSFSLNEKVEVTLFLKATKACSQVAVLDLLPGGFEIDLSDDGLANRKSLHEGPNTWAPDFIEVQEDRIIFFGDLPEDSVTFSYRLKPLSRGSYVVPALYGEGMYTPSLQFLGEMQTIKIE